MKQEICMNLTWWLIESLEAIRTQTQIKGGGGGGGGGEVRVDGGEEEEEAGGEEHATEKHRKIGEEEKIPLSTLLAVNNITTFLQREEKRSLRRAGH